MDFICFTSPCAEGALTPLDLTRAAVAAFLAILFIQSGMDKVVDRKGNMDWLTGHFSKSPLASLVGPMLSLLTLVELAAGVVSGIGAAAVLFAGTQTLAAIGTLLSVVAVLMLFFGQRMAKDYAGAAGLVPYFIVAAGGLLLMGLP